MAIEQARPAAMLLCKEPTDSCHSMQKPAWPRDNAPVDLALSLEAASHHKAGKPQGPGGGAAALQRGGKRAAMLALSASCNG